MLAIFSWTNVYYSWELCLCDAWISPPYFMKALCWYSLLKHYVKLWLWLFLCFISLCWSAICWQLPQNISIKQLFAHIWLKCGLYYSKNPNIFFERSYFIKYNMHPQYGTLYMMLWNVIVPIRDVCSSYLNTFIVTLWYTVNYCMKKQIT